MRNQELIGVNDLNKNANGGTELTTRRLFDLLDPSDLQGVQIITSRVRDLDPDKLRIYHLHDLPMDPEASHLAQSHSRDRFDRIVFSSNWQYQQFRTELQLPYTRQMRVIETGVDRIDLQPKTDPRTNPIRLIYTSTPHRGLEILIPVFEFLATQFDFIELDVFSSFSLYGWSDRDKPYQELFDRANAHPRIRYHGAQPNDVVRAAYQQAHVFAYPNIWPETSCRCLIEAMMAGCICVHPNYAALPDTSGGMTAMYDGTDDRNEHANLFARQLSGIIQGLRHNDMWSLYTGHLQMQSMYANGRFGWDNIIYRWKQLITEMKSDATR